MSQSANNITNMQISCRSKKYFSITGMISILMFLQLLMPILAKAQIYKYEQQQAAYRRVAWRTCQNYINAGYQEGQLTGANFNGDGSVSCDTTLVSFMIAPWHVNYWANR
jgi:hypothetical protein